MKKTLAALAVLGAFAGTAAAADVNLYGVVDTGLAYTYKNTELGMSDNRLYVGKNGSENQFGMQSGYNSGSRFGLKGTEDLGNGLQIGFKLENGFSSDDGNFKYENRLFGREASLSLISEFGTFSFGRMGASLPPPARTTWSTRSPIPSTAATTTFSVSRLLPATTTW